MPTLANNAVADPERQAAVLSKAASRAADYLQLEDSELAAILNVSGHCASHLRRGQCSLEHGSPSFELARLFVRLFCALDAITGSSEPSAQSWLRSANSALPGRPIELIHTASGLKAAISYVDSRRARL